MDDDRQAEDRRPEDREGDGDAHRQWQLGVPFMMIGLSLGGCALGYLLDRWLDGGLFFTVIGLVAGTLLGLYITLNSCRK